MFSSFVIAYAIKPGNKHFDLPSFYSEKMGSFGKWIAIICNLIILYGVLVAYLCGISTIIAHLFPALNAHQLPVMLTYFVIMFLLIVTGNKAISKNNLVVISLIWICFFLMIATAFGYFNITRLVGTEDWKYVPIVLPIAISAFHFHNIIPTVSKKLDYDFKSTCWAIFIGLFCGLVINLLWSFSVLGSLSYDVIVQSYKHGVPATVPMAHLLQNQVFMYSGLVFAVLAVTAAFIANGTGLFGFIGDLAHTYFKVDNKYTIGAISFLPPIICALVYPKIFLVAISFVGGIGEDLLFLMLPGVVLLQMAKGRPSKIAGWFKFIAWLMIIVSAYICIYVFCQKFLGMFKPSF
jgi:tyrosine-specific transport protein